MEDVSGCAKVTLRDEAALELDLMDESSTDFFCLYFSYEDISGVDSYPEELLSG